MNPERIEKEGWRGTLARLTTSFFLESGIGVADLLMSGVLARFPRLRFVSVESAIGWIPFLLESLDFHFKKYEPWVERPEFAANDLLPSDYFRRQVFANFWYEKLQPWHVEAIGTDNLLFETDYPHQTCLTGDEITGRSTPASAVFPRRIARRSSGATPRRCTTSTSPSSKR